MGERINFHSLRIQKNLLMTVRIFCMSIHPVRIHPNLDS